MNYIGDPSCRHNARSPFIRCALNPSGPCDGCPDFRKATVGDQISRMHEFFKHRIGILPATAIACSFLALGIAIGFGSAQHIAQEKLDYEANESIKKLSLLCGPIIKTDAEYDACLDHSIFLKVSSYCGAQQQYKACLEQYRKKGWGNLIDRESKAVKKPNVW